MSFDPTTRSKKFVGQRKPFGDVRRSASENGKPVGDLRSILAKKQAANITDLRTKLKPKALYTSKLASRSQPAMKQPAADVRGQGGQGRKPLKLTATFKSSVSSAVSGSSKPASREHERTRSVPASHRSSRSTSHKLPSYEEAKKISVTVPGLSRPVSEVRE